MAFQPQNDEHDSDEDDEDSNDDDDFVDANEHASHGNDEHDQDENEDSGGSDDEPYPESIFQEVLEFTSKATFAQATNKVAKLRNQLQQLASVEEKRDLKAEEERQRRRFNHELRLCKARCDELKRPKFSKQETEEEGLTGDEEADEEESEQELSEQELSEEEPTTKAPSGSAKTARAKKPSRKRDTSPA